MQNFQVVGIFIKANEISPTVHKIWASAQVICMQAECKNPII